jgi:RimJ/RimL family protein N-acetyltransferase
MGCEQLASARAASTSPASKVLGYRRRVELARTGRLLLRRWEEHDLPAFFDLYSRDEVTRWLGPHPRRALTMRQFRYPADA